GRASFGQEALAVGRPPRTGCRSYRIPVPGATSSRPPCCSCDLCGVCCSVAPPDGAPACHAQTETTTTTTDDRLSHRPGPGLVGDTLAKANKIVDIDRITLGQTWVIPGAPTVRPAPAATAKAPMAALPPKPVVSVKVVARGLPPSYVVEPDDTSSKVAARFK